MNKLLIITGPTAVGKTNLTVSLAKKFDGEIISADSRQVYQGMDVGTGKDIGNSRFETVEMRKSLTFGYYEVDGVKIWGLDIVKPDNQFNVADFLTYFEVVFEDIKKRNKLPIVVGGTALYLKSLLFPPQTAQVPQNEKLRSELEIKSVEELQQKLQNVDFEKWCSLNDSDQKNPRRLIRAIEVAEHFSRHPDLVGGFISWNSPKEDSSTALGMTQQKYCASDVFLVCLDSPNEQINQKIDSRVQKRLDQGIIEEIKNLISQGFNFDLPSMSAMGYAEFADFLAGKQTLEKSLELWTLHEKQYVKRQKTFLKKLCQQTKDLGIKTELFDISQNSLDQIKKKVEEWYTRIGS